jgi:hypothetical protein
MKKYLHLITFLPCLLLLSLTGTAQGQSTQPQSEPCIDCLRIRVGPPMVIRGPAPDIEDFTLIQLPGGRFRGFIAGGKTYAIDGDTPWDMGGPARVVLDRGAPGTNDACGQWIHHVEQSGNKVVAWVHDETGCNYSANFQTHQSVSLATSTDYGLTWKNLGQIITGRGAAMANRITGEGDCTAINGLDKYYYAYCWRNSSGEEDGATIVARALVSDPSHWKKYYQGKWDQPGLGGYSTGLPNGIGGSVARWMDTGQILLLGWMGNSGLGLKLSTDGVTFTEMPEPLIVGGRGTWHRPDPSEIISYPVLYDPKTGSNQLSSDSWMLFYMYVQPNEGLGRRYLVYRPVEVSRSRQRDEPPVGVLLARWYNPALHDRWSTTAAVPSVNGSEYKFEAKTGYLMTAPDPKGSTVELEECLSKPGQPVVHVLMQKSRQGHVCENHGYTRSRTAGFVYSSAQPGTQPLYSCYSAAEHSHFASNDEDCYDLGKREALLGYDLKE